MPRSNARAFISCTKRSMLPLTPSARTAAASLALPMITPLSKSSTDIVSPGTSQITAPLVSRTESEAVNGVSNIQVPFSRHSAASKTVISFAIISIESGTWAFCSCRIVPVSASIKMEAAASGTAASSAAPAHPLRTRQHRQIQPASSPAIPRFIIASHSLHKIGSQPFYAANRKKRSAVHFWCTTLLFSTILLNF